MLIDGGAWFRLEGEFSYLKNLNCVLALFLFFFNVFDHLVASLLS